MDVFPAVVLLPVTDKSPDVNIPVVDIFSEPNETVPPDDEIFPVTKLPAVTEPVNVESPATDNVPSLSIEEPVILEATLNDPVISLLPPTVKVSDKSNFTAPISLITLRSLFLKPIIPLESKISPLLNVKLPIVVPDSNAATVPLFLMYKVSANVSVNLRSIWPWIGSVTPVK